MAATSPDFDLVDSRVSFHCLRARFLGVIFHSAMGLQVRPTKCANAIKPYYWRKKHMKSEEALKQTEVGIEELVQALEQGKSKTLVRFLEFQARFHNYSFRNCLLIAMQNPSATFVAGFARWKQLGRFVKKGEKGLMILAPIAARRKTDGETDDAGNEEHTTRAVRGFRAAYVFDVSQTDGAELPEFSRISGEPGQKLARIQTVVRNRGIELETATDLGGARGLSQGGKILVLEGLAPAEEFAVTAHELAHLCCEVSYVVVGCPHF